MICTVAARCGVTTILSEDMHDGLAAGPLRVVNPFAPENAAAINGLLMLDPRAG